jgi:uracil-DNA glycosylase family 4
MINYSENSNRFEELKCEIIACRKCERMTAWREKVGMEKRRAFRDQEYWAKPVPGFGDENARVLLLGLAPGAHGSNRTGRMFTGDDSGRFLYAALHKAGFANQPNASHLDDGLTLTDVWITAVCRCAPPDNKPTREEMDNCQSFLLREFALLNRIQGIVAFGKIAYDAAFNLLRQNEKLKVPRFGHAVFYPSSENQPWILASYHPSRQNTQTGRLTAAMFDAIWIEVRRLLELDQTTSG